GQASGVIAALAVRNNVSPADVSIREVQSVLLDYQAYIMPYIDVNPQDPHFKAMQKVGATGVLKGFGVPYKWANQTWFYPERSVSEYKLVLGLRDYYPVLDSFWDASGEDLTIAGY